MRIKTYGINGLLEWHGILSAGGIKIKVSFTGGTTTGFGVAPATFTTKDDLSQYVIEHSEKFKKGQIFIVRNVEVKSTAKAVATPKKQSPLPKVEEPKEEVNEQKGEDAINTLTEVEFTCVDDAKDFFSEKFGEARSAIRSRAQAEEIAKKHSFTIKWV